MPEADAAPTADSPTSEQVALFALQVWQYKQGESVSLLVHLGDRLGLYRALRGAGPTTAAELADRTGLHRDGIEVRAVPILPLLRTGRIDYRRLAELSVS